MIKLSIMIPAVLDRGYAPIYDLLWKQVTRANLQAEIEILALFDNRRRSTGLKRQVLLDAAQGQFVTCLDDDDAVSDDYVVEVLATIHNAPASDVIVFNSLSKIDEGNPFVVRTGVEFENEQCRKEDGLWVDIYRKPWHWCVYASRIAKLAKFPDAYIDDDWYWIRQMLPHIQHQVRIDKVLHFYNYNSKTSLSGQGKPST